MGSEGFLTVKEAPPPAPGSDSDRVSVTVRHSIECAKNGNDVAIMKCDAEFSSGNEVLETQLCKNSSQPPYLQGEELSNNVSGGKGENCPGLEVRPLQQRAAKVNRSNSLCSKRPRMSKAEHSKSLNEIEESKVIFEKLESHNMTCIFPEKNKFPKSRPTKRDKRNFKVPSSKAKYESSLKLGAAIFGSAYGGNNFFGLYGLKHSIHDVTKLMDEPPLDELLRGTFDCPSLSKDKGKKTSITNESFLNSVRKGCSILQFPRSDQSQNMVEMDSSFMKKMSACQRSSDCAVESVGNGDKEQSCTSDMSSCQKEPCSENESPSRPLDFPLCQPRDVLERIALPPSQDLESLLLDVSKLAVTTKCSNNLCSDKQVSRQPSLPAFPWSHAFGGHSRINSDAVKLSTSRGTCQGRWARIGVIASSTDIDRGCFTNLDSFSYDQSLVPSIGSSDNKVFPCLFATLPFCQWNASSHVTHSKDSEATADAYCPRLLEAAQTLSEIATHSWRQNPNGIVRLPKKTSHKTAKGKNFKPTVKHEEMPSTPISGVGSDPVARSVEQIIPSKKPRVSIVENKNYVHSNNVMKGPCTWSSSKSSIPLPSKPVRNSIVDNKHSTASIMRRHIMMPPDDRILDKAYVRQPKAGKLVLVDWKRGKDK